MKTNQISTDVESTRSCNHDRDLVQYNKDVPSECLTDSIMQQIRRVIELHSKNGGDNKTMINIIKHLIAAYNTGQRDIDEGRNPLVNSSKTYQCNTTILQQSD